MVQKSMGFQAENGGPVQSSTCFSSRKRAVVQYKVLPAFQVENGTKIQVVQSVWTRWISWKSFYGFRAT
jgi:hypothetical protein